MATKNYYEVLDVLPTATDAEIKDAYRLLANAWHPDKFTPGSTQQQRANIKLQEINEAYSVLKDPQRRRQYDFDLSQNERKAKENAERQFKQEQRPKPAPRQQAAPSEQATPTNNYYRPYCNRCGTYVKPQVVSATYVAGGPQYIGSSITFNKFCSICGEPVFSQEDIDNHNRKKAAEAKRLRIIGGVVLLLFLGVPILFILIYCGAMGIALTYYAGFEVHEWIQELTGPHRGVMFNQLFSFGGAILGIVLAIQYFVCLIRRVSRLPWSIMLGLAWASFAWGLDIVWLNAKPGHMESPALTLADIVLHSSFSLCWLATIFFWSSRKRRNGVEKYQQKLKQPAT